MTKSRNAVRTWWFVREGYCLKKRTIFAGPSQADASGSWQAYRITSSAWKRRDGGIVIPSALAVLR